MGLWPLAAVLTLIPDEADADADNADDAAYADQQDAPGLEILVLPIEDEA